MGPNTLSVFVPLDSSSLDEADMGTIGGLT